MIKPQDIDSALERALALHNAGEHDQAAKGFAQVRAAFPKHYSAWYLPGALAYQRGGHLEEAVTLLSQARRLQPASLDCRLFLGMALADLGRHEEALPHLTAASRHFIDKPELWENLAKAHQALGHGAEATAAQQRYIELRPAPSTNAEFAPLYSTKRPTPIHPHAAMSAEVQELWTFFTKTLGWGTALPSRVAFDHLINAVEFARGKPVLDAGAGHKRYSHFFDNCVYLTQEHPSGIEFKRMQGITYDLISPIDEKIPLKDDTLAAVISTSVMEHVRYPERFLAEAHRVLHPGGRIYISVPFAYNEHETPYDFQRPTRYGLQAWLHAAGFNQVSVLPASNSTYGAGWYLMAAMRDEMNARGQSQRFNDLSPILKYCIDTANAATDDYLDDAALMPVGWLAIAQKDGALGEFPAWNREQWLQNCRL